MKNLFISFFLVATLSSQASASAVFLLMMGDVNGADEISLEQYKLVENTVKIHKDKPKVIDAIRATMANNVITNDEFQYLQKVLKAENEK